MHISNVTAGDRFFSDKAPIEYAVVPQPILTRSNGTKAVANTLGSRLFQQGLNAALVIVPARPLMPSGCGQLAALILWSLFLCGSTTFGRPVALIHFIRRHPEHKMIGLAGRPIRISRCLTVVSSLAGTFLGPLLFGSFYGRGFIHSVAGFRILLLEVTPSGCAFLLSQAFMASGRPEVVTILNALGFAPSIPFMSRLIPPWGILGAATAFTPVTAARSTLIYFSPLLFLGTCPANLIQRREDPTVLLDHIRLRMKPRGATV